MNIMNSTISDNAPGGIYNGGELVLMNSTVVGNTEGPGLFSDGGRLSVINSTIASNSGDIGGGIYSGSGTVMLSNSTIADNKASQMPVYGQLVGGDGDGGGI